MEIIKEIQGNIVEALQALYGIEVTPESVMISPTRKEFDGDFTIVVFPYVKAARKAPPMVGNEIGEYLCEHFKENYASFNTIKGFLNLVLSLSHWPEILNSIASTTDYGKHADRKSKVLIEFSSPNTNKPLHLGHVRNILLGWASSKIYEYAGYQVIKTQIVNDRGIAICKSMLAWEKFGEGQTPASTNTKSDHFVGDYYVLFETKFKEEYKNWQLSEAGAEVFAKNGKEGDAEAFFKKFKNSYFNEYSLLGKEAREMLGRWEAGDTEVIALWKKMNAWVYEGFEESYKRLGVEFDHIYYESITYKYGKSLIEEGLNKQIFYKKEDNSVWIDLEKEGMDHKLVLRSDGTSVYMTQDIGTAQKRFEDHSADKMVYVVADEQNYHFKALFAILKRLGEPYADGLHHLSYGMVDLPTGKMKSREGTVVDADDLVADVISEAKAVAQERGELEETSPEQQEDIYRKIGLAALKYFIIKVNPKKRMTFDPKESVDMQGQTGPYIQNAYVRIRSVLRKFEDSVDVDVSLSYREIQSIEKALMTQLIQFPKVILEAAENFDPSLLANYTYALAKSFHKFYHDIRILKAESEAAKNFRLILIQQVARMLKQSMYLLGIEMPEKM